MFVVFHYSSGDGTFSCVNIKNRKLELQSELFESELLSIAIMKVRPKLSVLVVGLSGRRDNDIKELGESFYQNELQSLEITSPKKLCYFVLVLAGIFKIHWQFITLRRQT